MIVALFLEVNNFQVFSKQQADSNIYILARAGIYLLCFLTGLSFSLKLYYEYA
jgi:Kef-type K+ transport system membrane component KefB